MKKLIKLFSKLLDYIWFYLIVVFFLDLLDADLYLYLVGLVLTPILFIPIEMILLKYFKTTLGKILFGLRYDSVPNWKQAFLLAWRSENLIQKRPKLLPHTLLIAAATMLSIFCITPEIVTRHFKSNMSQFSGASASTETWTKLTAADRPFSALFPKEPQHSEQFFQTFKYHEYSHKDTLTYTLGYVDLPRKYTKWGSKRVFQGVYKLVASDFAVKYRHQAEHDAFPSYEYEMGDQNKKYLGKLVLVGNILYRIEIAKEGAFTNEDKSVAIAFFNAFHPIKK